MPPPGKRLTIPAFVQMKAEKRKIVMLTAYDYPTAALLDQAGVDGILVGDSLAMVVQGRETTLPVTLDEMIYHAEMVGRAVQSALVVVDLPFPTNHLGVESAVASAGRILKQTRAQAVKLEGGADQANVIAGLTSAGIPVMAHVGLRPQAVHALGGYKVQRDEQAVMRDALAAQEAGAFSIVLECIPTPLAAKVTEALAIPTIGIGAGPDCDGQVLVLHDLLGFSSGYTPRFVKQYADVAGQISQAVSRYAQEVKNGQFPDKQHAFGG